MTQIQHNLRNQELQELNYKLPYLLFSSGVIKYMNIQNEIKKVLEETMPYQDMQSKLTFSEMERIIEGFTDLFNKLLPTQPQE